MMKRNTLRRIKNQLKKAEGALDALPVDLREAIENNIDLDFVKLMDDLSSVADAIDFAMDDDNGYALSALCRDDNPGMTIWYDPIGRKAYAPKRAKG